MASDFFNGRADRRPRGDVYRRILDVTVCAVLIPLTLPVMILAALGSAATLRAWPFFAQERIGRHGQTFRFFKIRSLPVSVPAYIDKHELSDHHIPRFCYLLRLLHLDELPQLFLVLIGRMSLVGPRPEMEWLHVQLPERFASARTSVRPGCTGLWQVSTACTDLIGAAPEYDDFYLEHRTLRFDLWVLSRTALKMAGIRRPVTLHDVPRWVMSATAVTASGHEPSASFEAA